jgi:hypothetical protein
MHVLSYAMAQYMKGVSQNKIHFYMLNFIIEFYDQTDL